MAGALRVTNETWEVSGFQTLKGHYKKGNKTQKEASKGDQPLTWAVESTGSKKTGGLAWNTKLLNIGKGCSDLISIHPITEEGSLY